MDPSDCPDDDILAAFASGQLNDDDLNLIAQHLEHCPACLKVVSNPDAFVQHLQQIHQEGISPWTSMVSLRPDDVASTYFFIVDRTPPTGDAETFFNALAKSGLFDADDLAAVRREWKAYRSTDLAAFAQTLAVEGRLTEFHVRQLLRGKTRGWILGDYVVLHPISAGGKDWMYRASHRRQHRNFALKITPPHLARPTSALKQFQREIEAIAKLRHPRLVTALDAGEADGISYLVMDEMHGHSLAEWVELNGPMRALTAADMIRQSAEAIAAAHDAGVIHRDLNPSNLWIEVFTGSGRASPGGLGIKVLDFGFARMMQDEPSQRLSAGKHQGVGMPGYVAPEQAKGAAEARSDIYSLGCTLYYLLSGKAPEAVNGVLPPLESSRESVPEVLQAIYRRMTAASPRDRYASADDLVIDLDAFLAGTKVLKSRPKWIAPAALAGAAAAILIPLLIFWPTAKPPERAVADFTGVIRVNGALPPPLKDAASTDDVIASQKAWAAALGVPLEYTNRQGMKLRLIPAGTMPLGTPPGQVQDRLKQLLPGSRDWLWLRDNGRLEAPQRNITITQPYYMGETEVTVAQFRAFVDATKYQTRAEADGRGGVRSTPNSTRQSPALTWRSPGYSQTDSQPVVQVEYADAEAFCRWLSEVDRRPYSLPTEAQGEFACRAGRTTRWFWGDDPDAAADFVSDPTPETFVPAETAKKKPNAFGLFDMSGNVAEWCSDWFAEEPPATAAVDPTGPPQGTTRTARGGAFVHPIPDGVASATRLGPADPRQDFVGFRVIIPLRVEK